ncbi:UDP-N-acetylmuramoyl-tripeptide--D-alanyl-D-alanine ligase [Candidatus Contubernalis alkaliaceticus]|uniref:UDP-N-acetylmuramoyl-tripeptide--D-alanyl-D- alanine ligase n=1 Tax=Candidatus Contubernalis alkaliaceticus TaxID=338645 RepID=UPI001F4C1DB8|nr:UDP-N-acetylmuramoyl-tripeptide--D-alanyl-D-alanine ligase [Candidatus Contubernalis alkalaceticus]UNC92878.1 UDP-N-acetylmuramoyl-tripeptide--D-alanyl-D-alanine ligase [Candidatus Contubernalis alkalaceticus]
MDLTIEEILKVTKGELLQGNVSRPPTGFSIDTRTLKSGEFFVALKGEHTDGHKFLSLAAQRGASGALVSELTSYKIPQEYVLVRVKDSLKALQDIAAYYRRKLPVRIIGVTGSSGKTTTKDLIAGVLEKRFHTLKTLGNLNNHLGLPLMLLKLTSQHQAAVLEMGMSGREEIRFLARLSAPEIGIITNIGEAHYELLGSREAIAEAKGELLEEMGPDGTAILNGDDFRQQELAKKFPGKVIFYGMGTKAEIKAFELRSIQEGQERGTAFAVQIAGSREEFILPLVGEHNVYNALAAVACGLHLGLNPEEIRQGLWDFSMSAMRMDIQQYASGITVINDAYNANLSSTKASLKTLSQVGRGHRCFAVLGDMLELGDIREECHREVGREAVRMGIHCLLGMGPLMSYAVEEARKHGLKEAEHFEEHPSLCRELIDKIMPGDYILIKGSRGMKMEKIVECLSKNLAEPGK